MEINLITIEDNTMFINIEAADGLELYNSKLNVATNRVSMPIDGDANDWEEREITPIIELDEEGNPITE